MESAAASVFLKSVMGRLFLVLEKEYNKHKGLAHQTQSIQQDLRMIAAAMDDQLRALERNDRTAVGRLYNEEMLNLQHDIEDCVDRFLHRLRCKQRVGGSVASSLVRRVAHELKKVQSRSSFADEIQKLKRRLKEAHQRVLNVGQLNNGGSSSTTVSKSALPHRITRNPLGIENPMEELFSLLDEVDGEPEQPRVISITGFGGLGKTTLARAVYDSPQAREKFDCRAWVGAASGDGTRGILRDIIQQIRPKDAMNVDSHYLEAWIKEYLKDTRYLIVIDDIRMDEWSTIKVAFEDNSRSSRILLTTTVQSVATKCSHGNGYVYQMNSLGDEDSRKIALPWFCSPELEQGSTALLRKCDGHPLALVCVSDYLKSSSEPTGELCATLGRNLGVHLNEMHGDDNFSHLRETLMDSYDSFSGHALTCLLYLSIFSHDRPFKRKVVIRRWLAEGYARTDSLRDEQDIANENFDKLMDRHIIQPVDTRNNSKVKTCKTHGIMHEFVQHKSMMQRFLAKISHEYRPGLSANAHNKRHICVHARKPTTECAASEEDFSRVRSLTAYGDADGAIPYIRNCKLVRVLDLEECSDLKGHHLKHIWKLWHLKYLSLRGTTVSELPSGIEGLHCLETLDLRRTNISSLPVEVILLPHLVNLFGMFMIDKDDIKNVKKMSKVEKFFTGNRSSLQVLAGFVTDGREGFLQLIGHMKRLRKVKMWCKYANSNCAGDLWQAIQLFTKVPIDRDSDRSLSIDCSECTENFLSSLNFDPCPEGFRYDLRSLKLHGKLSPFLPFVTLLSGLTELSISSDTLAQHALSELGTLNRLLYFKLTANRLETFEIKQGAFPSLRRFCFVVQSLDSALPTIEQGALPNLVSLQLLCRGLVDVSSINIINFKHLKEITIDGTVSGQIRQHWELAAKKHPNRPRVLLLKTYDPTECEEPEYFATAEKRKRCEDNPASDDGLDFSLKKMKLAEPQFFTFSSDHPSSGGNDEINAIMQ